MNYSNQLKALRNYFNLTQESMATILDMPLATVKKLEQPARLSENMKVETLLRICNNLNVNSNWLVQLLASDFINLDNEQPREFIDERQFDNIERLLNLIKITSPVSDKTDTTAFVNHFSISVSNTANQILCSRSMAALREIDVDTLPLVYVLRINTLSTSYPTRHDYFSFFSNFECNTESTQGATLGILYLLTTLQDSASFAEDLFNDKDFVDLYATTNENARDKVIGSISSCEQLPKHAKEYFLTRCNFPDPKVDIRKSNTETVEKLNSLQLLKFNSIQLLDYTYKQTGTEVFLDTYLAVR